MNQSALTVKDKRWKSFGCEDEFAWEAFGGSFGGEIRKADEVWA
jgi:hypothetical protein